MRPLVFPTDRKHDQWDKGGLLSHPPQSLAFKNLKAFVDIFLMFKKEVWLFFYFICLFWGLWKSFTALNCAQTVVDNFASCKRAFWIKLVFCKYWNTFCAPCLFTAIHKRFLKVQVWVFWGPGLSTDLSPCTHFKLLSSCLLLLYFF